MSILKIENVTKNYGRHEVLKGVNLLLDKPGIVALVGPNGAGKSTLFNIISNLLKPTAGTIEVLGKKNTDPSIFLEASFLKDNRVLYEYLTGLDHLDFIRIAQKLPKSRVDEVIAKMNIQTYVKKKVGTYSLGMKQHLLIAMALLNKPKLLILDEPLNGLDPTSVILVRRLLKSLAAEGSVVLISSHTLSEIDQMTGNILFLKDGQIVESTF
ncbi:ABC transporter ATP-binding protein, partial [uncultured Levyella sp.]